jgi:hypothetical protein
LLGSPRYTVFRTRTGHRAVVVINMEGDKALLKVELPNPGKIMLVTPEQPETEPKEETIEFPPRSAAGVLEP